MKVKQVLHLLEGDVHFIGAPKKYCMKGINADRTPTYDVYSWLKKIKTDSGKALAECTVEGIKSTGFDETTVFVKEPK